MGGDHNQKPLTPMSRARHDQLHKDMYAFLETKTDGKGHTMRTKSGYPRRIMWQFFTREERLAALAEFYKKFIVEYPDATRDFFIQHPTLW